VTGAQSRQLPTKFRLRPQSFALRPSAHRHDNRLWSGFRLPEAVGNAGCRFLESTSNPRVTIAGCVLVRLPAGHVDCVISKATRAISGITRGYKEGNTYGNVRVTRLAYRSAPGLGPRRCIKRPETARSFHTTQDGEIQVDGLSAGCAHNFVPPGQTDDREDSRISRKELHA